MSKVDRSREAFSKSQYLYYGVLGFCITLVLIFVMIWSLSLSFPIENVKFVGERRYVVPQTLIATITPELKKGFFRLKVSTLKRDLLLLTWVKQVDVRKVWPGRVVIQYEEHTPEALWKDKGVFSTQGVLFFPKEALDELRNLPVLQGPEGKAFIVWQQYKAMNSILSAQQLTISRVTLATRGAWQLKLSNGITLVLGTSEMLPRLRRFAKAYEKRRLPSDVAIQYVDLRYTSGMAIGWKSS